MALWPGRRDPRIGDARPVSVPSNRAVLPSQLLGYSKGGALAHRTVVPADEYSGGGGNMSALRQPLLGALSGADVGGSRGGGGRYGRGEASHEVDAFLLAQRAREEAKRRANEEDRIDALRAQHPGKSTAELRAMLGLRKT